MRREPRAAGRRRRASGPTPRSATSVPVPMATPRSAWASAGASLMPSPTMAPRPPLACRRSMTAALSPGRTSAMHALGGDPDLARDACAVAGLVAREQPHLDAGGRAGRGPPRPTPALTGSSMTMRPAGRPSIATNTTVPPSAGAGSSGRPPGPSSVDALLRRAAARCRRGPRRRRRAATPRPTIASNAFDRRGSPARLARLCARWPRQRMLAAPSPSTRRGPGRVASSKPAAASTSSTAGRPSVSVPVLSKTTVSTRRRASSASPPRTRMPGLGALARPDHDRGRGGQAHGAGAGDDHDADESRQREGQPRLGARRRTR